jgi:hypothetical protein
MRWVRARLGVGSRLALFALALQIVLSFGHVHLGDFKHGGRGLAVAGTPAGPSAPTQQPQQPVSDADNYCAICATIHLAATSLLPQAPQLPEPFAAGPVKHANFIATSSFSTRRAPFQSRAPPLA